MRVVIPAAGSGKRFADAGYRDPKPLISVCGTPMLRRVLDMVRNLDPYPLVIASSPLVATVAHHWSAQPVLLPRKQNGAALSILSVNAWLRDEEAVMFVDSDNIIAVRAWESFAQHAVNCTAAGAGCIMAQRVEGVVSPTGTGPYSYIQMEADGRVSRVAEKVTISDLATCGCNAFPTWAAARHAICSMIGSGDCVQGEYYLVPAYNYLPNKDGHLVPAGAWQTVGTPAALHAYNTCWVESTKELECKNSNL